MTVEPLFEDFDCGGEVVAEFEEEVDVVEVSSGAEAVGEVVSRVDGDAQSSAARAEEAEVAFEGFGRWRGGAEVGANGADRDRSAVSEESNVDGTGGSGAGAWADR